MGTTPFRGSEDVLLSADDVVDRLMECPDLRSAASNCVLPAVKVGTEWRFHKRDLDAWIAKHSEPQPQ